MNRTVLGIAAVWIYGGVGLVLAVAAALVGVIVFYGPKADANMPAIQHRQEQTYDKVNEQLCDRERAQMQQDGEDPSSLTDEGCPTSN